MLLYERLWRNKWLTDKAQSIEEMARLLEEAARELRAMQAKGVTLGSESAVADDFATLETSDPTVAAEFGFSEAEFDHEEDGETEEEREDAPNPGSEGRGA